MKNLYPLAKKHMKVHKSKKSLENRVSRTLPSDATRSAYKSHMIAERKSGSPLVKMYKPEKRKPSNEHPVDTQLKRSGVSKRGSKAIKSILRGR